MRTFLTFIMISFMINLQGQSIQPGDVLITGINCKDPDQFCFLITKPIAGNQMIYFTDCGWNDLTGFRPGEGLITYSVSASGLAAGTWITYPDDPGFTSRGISGFFGLSTDGDQIYCFTGSLNSPYFISAINLDGNNWATTSTSNQTGTQPPLADSLSPAIPESDNAVWDCNIITGESIYQLVGNPSHWIHSDTRQLLPPVCSWQELGFNLSNDSIPEAKEPEINLLFYSNTFTFTFKLDCDPIKVNLYTVDGVALASLEPKQESAYFYTLDLPPLNFSVCVLEIITFDRVKRTLIHIP